MDFKGRLRLPDEAGSGIPVDLRIEDVYLELWADGDELGTWRLEVVAVQRVNGNLFSMNLDGEHMQFLADDPLGFAYEGVAYVDNIGERLRKRKPWKRKPPQAREKPKAEPVSEKMETKRRGEPKEPDTKELGEDQPSPISRLERISATRQPEPAPEPDELAPPPPDPARIADPWVGVEPNPVQPEHQEAEYVSFFDGPPPSAPSEPSSTDFVPFSVGSSDQAGPGRGYVFDPFPQERTEATVDPGPAPYVPTASPEQDLGFVPESDRSGWFAAETDAPLATWPDPASAYEAPVEPPAYEAPVFEAPAHEPFVEAPPVFEAAVESPPVEVPPSADPTIIDESRPKPPGRGSLLDRLTGVAGKGSRTPEPPVAPPEQTVPAETAAPGFSTDRPAAVASSTAGQGTTWVPLDPRVSREAAERIEHAAERIESAADRIDAGVAEPPTRRADETRPLSPAALQSAPVEPATPPTTDDIRWPKVLEDTGEIAIEDEWAAVAGEFPSAPEMVAVDEPATVEDELPVSPWAVPEWPVAPRETGLEEHEPVSESTAKVAETEDFAAPADEWPTTAPDTESVGVGSVAQDDSSWEAAAGLEPEALEWAFEETEVESLAESSTADAPIDAAAASVSTDEPVEAGLSAAEDSWGHVAGEGFGDGEAGIHEDPLAALDRSFGDELRRLVESMSSTVYDLSPSDTDEAAPTAVPPSDEERIEEAASAWSLPEAPLDEVDQTMAEMAASPWEVPEEEPETEDVGAASLWEIETEPQSAEELVTNWEGDSPVSPWHVPAEAEWTVPTIEATTASPVEFPVPANVTDLHTVPEVVGNAAELDSKVRADRAASGQVAKKRAKRGLHEHSYEAGKTVGGITRRICTGCGHLSFSSDDLYQDW